MAKSTVGIKKNDLVRVISGKDRGKTGKVLKVSVKTHRVIVERINMIKRHTKPNQQNRLGGIVEKEGSLHISNVMVVCPQAGKPTRISHRMVTTDSGKTKSVRASAKSGAIMDKT